MEIVELPHWTTYINKTNLSVFRCVALDLLLGTCHIISVVYVFIPNVCYCIISLDSKNSKVTHNLELKTALCKSADIFAKTFLRNNGLPQLFLGKVDTCIYQQDNNIYNVLCNIALKLFVFLKIVEDRRIRCLSLIIMQTLCINQNGKTTL